MRTRLYFTLFLCIALVGIAGMLFAGVKQEQTQSHATAGTSFATTSMSTATQPTAVVVPVDQKPIVKQAMPVAVTSSVTVVVEGVSYSVSVLRDEKVIDVMKKLASESAFTFTSQEYPSMGVFIDSVNGKKNANGMYWILYINGESSKVGASLAVVKSDDVVEWRYKENGDY